MGEVESRGAIRSMRVYSQTPSPSYSRRYAPHNTYTGDNMKDDKTMTELMKALTEYLKAKTAESKIDNEFSRRVLFDDNEVTCIEDGSWPTQFEEDWG